MLEFWWVFPIAMAICVTVCVVGISGSVLFVPLFTLAFPALGFPMTATEAVQIGLFTEIFGFASSTSAFIRNRMVDYRVAGYALIFAVPTAVAGGVLANVLPPTAVLVVISFAMLLFSYLLYRAPKEEDQSDSPTPTQDVPAAEMVEHRDRQGRTYRYRRTNDGLRAAAMTVGGLFEGLAGFAVGEIAVTEQVMRRMPLRIAIGTNHLIIAGSATAAALTHLTAVLGTGGEFPWNIVVMTVPAVIIGGQLAGWLAGRVPQDTLRHFLAVFLILIALLTITRAALDAGASAVWLMIGAALVLFGLLGRLLWRRRTMAAKLCYTSEFEYCR